MKVELTGNGEEALADLFRFLIDDLEVPVHIAERVKADVIEALTILGDFPEMGRAEDLLEKRERTYRWIKVREHFKVVYYIDVDKNKVFITDIFDTRQDPSQMRS